MADKKKIKTSSKKTAVASRPPVKSRATNQASGFLSFIRQQGVVGLAVGLAIGTAAGASVKKIVDGFINPIVGFLIGGINLADLKWVVVEANKHGRGGLTIEWGGIVSSLITLIATALVIYLIIHLAKLDRLDKKKS